MAELHLFVNVIMRNERDCERVLSYLLFPDQQPKVFYFQLKRKLEYGFPMCMYKRVFMEHCSMVRKWSVVIGFEEVTVLPCSFVAFLTSCVCVIFASGTLHLVESSFCAPSALKKLALVSRVVQGAFIFL